MLKPVCFRIIHRSGYTYKIWYFENLDLFVKVSNGYNQYLYHANNYHPPEDSFKPIPRELFDKIVNSEVFEVR
jgi:hypothetical protein